MQLKIITFIPLLIRKLEKYRIKIIKLKKNCNINLYFLIKKIVFKLRVLTGNPS